MAKYENDHNPTWTGPSANLGRGNYGRGMNEGTQGVGRDGSQGYGVYEANEKADDKTEERHPLAPHPTGFFKRLRRYFFNEKHVR